MNVLSLMIIFTEISLFSGCAGIEPTVKYQPGQHSKLHQADIRDPMKRAYPHWRRTCPLVGTPELKTGNYTVRTSLVYDLNRYNELAFTEDQTTLSSISLAVKVECVQ